MTQVLTNGGTVFMVVTWAAILALNAFCFFKVFRKK